MFIYEKRLIDKSTGQANDTLNITFEGNKPVENPEVVITKDGVVGIGLYPIQLALWSEEGSVVIADDKTLDLVTLSKGNHEAFFSKKLSYTTNAGEGAIGAFIKGTNSIIPCTIVTPGTNEAIKITSGEEMIIDIVNDTIYVGNTAYVRSKDFTLYNATGTYDIHLRDVLGFFVVSY